jgi:outer membrane protein OmpA-like peptidoglycan-associated protein
MRFSVVLFVLLSAVFASLFAMSGPPAAIPGIGMSISGGTNREAWLSPNWNGVHDTVSFDIRIPEGVSASGWQMVILDSQKNTVKTLRNPDGGPTGDFWRDLLSPRNPVGIPRKYTWDGSTAHNGIVADGTYSVYFRLEDKAGRVGFSETNIVHVSASSPTASFELYQQFFSPDGDGVLDDFPISQHLSSNADWRAEIRDISGKLVRSWDWGRHPPDIVRWDGRDAQGKVCPDGSYDYIALGTDDAGNSTIAPVNGIHLSTKKHSAFLETDRRRFSPNGDGFHDTVTARPVVPDTNDLDGWILSVSDRNGSVLQTWSGKNMPVPVTWGGLTKRGDPWPDGSYAFTLTLRYLNGDNAVSEPLSVSLDTTPPTVKWEATPLPFSPDGDGVNDTLYMRLDLADRSGIERWKLTVLDPDGKPFKIWRGQGNPLGLITWDGRGDSGELVESARDYRVKLEAVDQEGNGTGDLDVGAIPVDVLVERTELGMRIRINAIGFDFGKAELLHSDFPILDRTVQILARYPGYRVEIQGHTDNIDSEDRNMELSLARARAVADYLARKGIDPSRLSEKGFAFRYPVADNSTEEGRRKNRRVEFILRKD